MSPAHKALSRAADKAGGQLALAKAIETTQSNVWTWLKKSKRGAPAEWVLSIEGATGIPRHELRPDLYPPPAGAEPVIADAARPTPSTPEVAA